MKISIDRYHSRFTAIRKCVAAKCLVQRTYPVFLVFAPDRAGIGGESLADDSATGAGLHAESVFSQPKNTTNLPVAVAINAIGRNAL